MMKQLFFLLALLALGFTASAQRMISGVVKDDSGETLAGVTVSAKGASAGASTDANGMYKINVPESATALVFSYLGYDTREIEIPAGGTLDVVMSAGSSELAEVVISTGSRASQRTITDSPLPIDVFSNKDIVSTGQPAFDRALTYRVPSFNSVQTPVNDATSLLDPYEIRNMGPSRTLVLINGKRKNLSSLIYIQTSPGRGEGGADISAIPTDAIKRIEILRDGASAQYGSDAIAGVMNVILKDRYDYGSVTLNTGITGKGDGELVGLSLNNGANIGSKGFVNYTISLSHQALANRPGTVDAEGEASDFGADISQVREFLALKPDAGNINGDPEKAAAKFLVNMGLPVSNNVDFYANAAYVYKKVNSFANYRTPYWRTTDDGLLTPAGQKYLGYVPTFEGDLTDYNGTVGFKSTNNGWLTDVSFTTGGNQQLYTVANSRNRSLGRNSPIYFKPGGYAFSHNVGNIDITKDLLSDLHFGVGMEFRKETFNIMAGDTASFVGTGADSFPGIGEANETENTRYNYGGYVDLSYDISKNFLINGTYRAERYSDFGNTSVYKVSTRYKLADGKATIRASYSTGFRAPSLHQIYLQIAQQSFVPGQGIQSKGIFNNNSAQAKLLGVPKLQPEKSTNITVGLGLNPNRNVSVSIDYYNIAVKDRIILGSEISSADPTTTLYQILSDNGIVAASFFTNGINTKTSGIDFVFSHRNTMIGKGKLGINLAGNYTLENALDGDVIVPKIIADAGQSIFDKTQEHLLLTSRPKYKGILGLDLSYGRWGINLNNTLFGPTTFHQAGLDSHLNTEFKPAVVTDLGLNFDLGKGIMLNVNVNNIANVLPKWDFVALDADGQAILNDPAQVKVQSNLITFNQRYSIVTYDGSQFSQLGTTLSAQLSVRF